MVMSSSPHLLKRWIGLNLRQLRKDAGRGRPEVAKRIGMSRTSVGHMESARNLPSQTTLEVLLNYYGVPERFDDFVNLVSAARKGRSWWEHLSGAAPSWFDLYLGLEAGAAELCSFETYVMPGILQTPEYAEAIVRCDPDLTDEQVSQRVELRTGRQAILDRDDAEEAVRLWVVLDESVLYRPRGGPKAMAAQLNHLLTMAERPRIDIQVLPLDAGAHIAQHGGFHLLKFPHDFVGDPGIAYVDLLPEGRYFEEPEEVALYERAMTRLKVLAETPEESTMLIHRAAEEIDS